MNKREINNKDEFRCRQFYDSLIHFLEYQSNPFYRTDEMGVYDACFYVEIEEKEYPIVGIKKLYCSTEEEIAIGTVISVCFSNYDGGFAGVHAIVYFYAV